MKIKKLIKMANTYQSENLSQIECEAVLEYVKLAEIVHNKYWKKKVFLNKSISYIKKYYAKKLVTGTDREKKACKLIIKIIDSIIMIIINSPYFKNAMLNS